MKSWFLSFAAFLLLAIAFTLMLPPKKTAAANTDRFEPISQENHTDRYVRFNVWHDRETGQEIVCVRWGENGCYLTGRKW